VPVHFTAPTDSAPAASPGVGMLPGPTASGPKPAVWEKRVSSAWGPASWRTTTRHEPAPAVSGVVAAWVGPAGALRWASTQAPDGSRRSTATLARAAAEGHERLNSRGVPGVGAIGITPPSGGAVPRQCRWP
jgi:hypothetical protein